MNHFLFPEATHPDKRTPKYGTVAVPALIQLLKNHGSAVEDLEAQVFGGATLSYDDTENQGWQNVRVALNALAEEGIRVCSQDVGGTKGRRVVYHTATNEAIVMKTDKIRQEDWMSYLGHVVD